jgi:CDGSH-type Zn-finger protein
LRYERLDGSSSEIIPDEMTGTFAENGPLYLRGAIKLTDSEGKPLFEGTRVALCRCGASKNKPFCDRNRISSSEGKARAKMKPCSQAFNCSIALVFYGNV